MEIAGKRLGQGATFIIAEAGVNHNGDLGLAKELIDVAAEAGADAVKFQTLNASAYISKFAPKARYQKENTDEGESQVEMVRKYELSAAEHTELWRHCQERRLPFLSTAFDASGVDFLHELGVAVYKIPSGEINNTPLLRHIAAKGRPIILSTGMASIAEVEQAVDVLESTGVREISLLHCVSNYPADPRDANLRAMDTMSRAFGLPVGYSDHTKGVEIAVAAVALGAKIIEKHFTTDINLPGPDHQASLEPDELKMMVQSIRNVEQSLGDGRKRPADSEENTKSVARKSLVATRIIEVGTVLSEDMLTAKRPGTGVAPNEMKYVLGRRVNKTLEEDEILVWDQLD